MAPKNEPGDKELYLYHQSARIYNHLSKCQKVFRQRGERRIENSGYYELTLSLKKFSKRVEKASGYSLNANVLITSLDLDEGIKSERIEWESE